MNKRKEKIEEYFQNTIKIGSIMNIKKEHLFDKYCLHKSQIIILYKLFKSENLTTSALAKALDISDSAITQLIDSLFKLKLIDRVQSDDDRRITYINLSAYGKDYFNKFKTEHLEYLDHWLSKLSDDELETLILLQNKLLN